MGKKKNKKKKERENINVKTKVYVIFTILLIALIGVYYYTFHPAINIHLEPFWGAVIVVFIGFGCIFALNQIKDAWFSNVSEVFREKKLSFITKFFFVLALLSVFVFAIGSIAGLKVFRAKTYSQMLKVKTYDFAKDIDETEQITDIALMDTASAKIFGNRKIGSLSDVVSQYEVEDAYTQISVDKQPFKVSALKYASFFKWWNNKDKGIPGYVKINPVNSNAEYVELDKGMKYVPSAYFNYNLERHVQLKYPSKIINGYNFEVDDNGKPYYVCPTVTAKVGLFGGVDVNGVIICDPTSGDCDYYRINNIPSWVDNVYNGHLLEKKYNWYGLLSDGFINSIIGQKGCKQTTDDFGYKIIGDDVWIYTGVTSVNGDQSNIGFVMMNQRTSEARYYKVSGAEEHSAMAAAEGEVQEKGYKASFPSLINVAGVPTYIMVLKDDGGLVKMYAMVNVSQYNMVATATSQSEVFSNYKKMLAKSGKGENIERDLKTIDIELRDIRFINTDDGTMVYLVSEDGKIFKQAFAENEHLVGLKTGDKLRIEYESSGDDADDIAYMTSYEYIEK
ncbi:MAG: hypothetical protein MSH21_00935 [Clostridium sp.]|uniref:hypothetical protein n=1 Tax=Butyribacter sp. TaxID=2822465 RepID=UPI002A9DC656|nr:hypothetical protein [Clostridium sp.]MDY5181337.1 hypothetical protein [Butyribacter sp.]